LLYIDQEQEKKARAALKKAGIEFTLKLAYVPKEDKAEAGVDEVEIDELEEGSYSDADVGE
jgi:ribosomal protein L16/L10AE